MLREIGIVISALLMLVGLVMGGLSMFVSEKKVGPFGVWMGLFALGGFAVFYVY